MTIRGSTHYEQMACIQTTEMYKCDPEFLKGFKLSLVELWIKEVLTLA